MAGEQRGEFRGASRWLRVASLVVAALFVAFWLTFAVGEVVGGDPSGLAHLAPALAMALLVIIALRRPAPGAVAFVTLGVAWTAYYLVRSGFRLEGSAAVLLVAGPFVLVGLLLGAALIARPKPSKGRDES
jgi:hypothetical protein